MVKLSSVVPNLCRAQKPDCASRGDRRPKPWPAFYVARPWHANQDFASTPSWLSAAPSLWNHRLPAAQIALLRRGEPGRLSTWRARQYETVLFLAHHARGASGSSPLTTESQSSSPHRLPPSSAGRCHSEWPSRLESNTLNRGWQHAQQFATVAVADRWQPLFADKHRISRAPTRPTTVLGRPSKPLTREFMAKNWVGAEGLEPSRPRGQWILSPPCLPFHHAPMCV